MTLLTVPYNNAMRLGQGFNSYTQQICIDDAVVVDPDRAENVVTNDGTTMRIMSQLLDKPSVWNRQDEVINDDTIKRALTRIKKDPASASASAALLENLEPVAKASALTAMGKQGEESIEVKGNDNDNEGKFDEEGYDKEGYDKEGYNREGYNREGYNEKGYNEKGYNEKGYNEKGYNEDGYNEEGYNEDGYNKEGYNEKGYNKEGYNEKGYKEDGYNKEGLDKDGYNREGYDRDGHDKDGKDKYGHHEEDEDDEKKAAKRRLKEDEERLREQRRLRLELEQEKREEERERRKEEREEQRKIREEEREWKAKRREETRKAISDAADAKKEALTLDDLAKIKAQNEFIERFSGMATDEEKMTFDPTAPKGPSQTVTYTSKFIDRLSDVTEDMCVSGALSIKAGKIGGSGRGSFVDSDKFKESDLKFYVSVKVTNQSLNFKDALVYYPTKQVLDAEQFNKVYGDSFISGFVEGGEFNALVSMKVLNKAKMSDIKAEAKVALTVGPVDVTAEGNVGIARSNLETNTETTIQVSWCGGGHIKPMEQAWNIQSIMQAAARFPDLVAECPQRTYAVLTKYEALRSFINQKPKSFSPLQYEVAQVYTNALMDSFMTYKSLYKKTGEQMISIQSKLLEIVSWEENKGDDKETVRTTATNPIKDQSRFEATIGGLADARTAMRRQMMLIVNEVYQIEKDPKIATEEDHLEPFQSPAAFETRIPVIRVPSRLLPKSSAPLRGRRIGNRPQTEEEQLKQMEDDEEADGEPELFNEADSDKLSDTDLDEVTQILVNHPKLGLGMRITPAIGHEHGQRFNNLDFVRPGWEVAGIQVEVLDGAVVAVQVRYDNGLILRKGDNFAASRVVRLDNLQPDERITSAMLECGKVATGADTKTRVTAVRLYTNRGRRLLAQAGTNERVRSSDSSSQNNVVKDGVEYKDIKGSYFDAPIEKGTFKGFFGCIDGGDMRSGLPRLGLIWGTFSPKPGSRSVSESIESDDSDISEVKEVIYGAQCGDLSLKADKTSDWTETIPYDRPYPEKPSLMFGVSDFTQSHHADVGEGITARPETITTTGFDVLCAGRNIVNGSFSDFRWMTLLEDRHVQVGSVEIPGSQADTDPNKSKDVTQTFARSFEAVPSVSVWISAMHYPTDLSSIQLSTESVGRDKFTIRVQCEHGPKFSGFRIGFLAFDPTKTQRHLQTGVDSIRAEKAEQLKSVNLEGFKRKPATFLALRALKFDRQEWAKVTAQINDTKKSTFTYVCYTYYDNCKVDTEWTWIAME